jgi:hypothetical protein
MMDSPVYPSGVGNAEDLPVITIYDLIKAAIEIGKDEGIHVRIFPSNATRFGLTKDRYVSLIYGGLLSGFQVVDPRKTAITLKVTCNLVINELSGPMCSNAKVQVNGENVSVADAFTKNPVFLRAMRDTDSVPWKAAN